MSRLTVQPLPQQWEHRWALGHTGSALSAVRTRRTLGRFSWCPQKAKRRENGPTPSQFPYLQFPSPWKRIMCNLRAPSLCHHRSTAPLLHVNLDPQPPCPSLCNSVRGRKKAPGGLQSVSYIVATTPWLGPDGSGMGSHLPA